ncbi:MAG: hypothetical protein K2J91_03310 [Lachnospiraceae bacterium]|nr:hypothetical protein [Lachnospiraceae bacterium]
MDNKTLLNIAIQLGYEFDDIRILRQAFTRKSYSEEHNGEHHNEVLEFYGDKALEFIVMKKLSEYYGSTTQNGKYASEKAEGQLTEIKKKLVCKKMLAHRIDMLGFAEHILMGKGDVGQKVQNQESVKEDLFESIVGAVAIDCEWDADILEDVVDRMIDVELYLEKGFNNDENYVDLIQTWCQKRYGWIPEYNFYETEDDYECTLTLSDDYDDFEGVGYSKREARMNAAQNAYEYLEENDELLLPIDEVGEPELDRAINQLQELYQKGYIDEPYYKFYEEHDNDGNPIWRCECHIKDANEYYWVKSTSKKHGKKKVAYDMLCDVIEWDD